MIRFRNAASNLETVLSSFDELYIALKDKNFFNNEDIAQVLAKANLMASSGFTGDSALSLGANKNKSRDKTYNNAKMFAETYRLLGLISVVNNVSSNYRFTYIGEHMAKPDADKKKLVEECVLGVNNPNRIMDVSYTESVRFFACTLLAMSEMNGVLCRDEMILGPMNVNDNLPNEFQKMLNYLKELREKKSYSIIQEDLEKLAKSLCGNKKDGMKVDSVQNCTRFPISVLKYCGWVENENKNIYGKKIRFMKLTQYGYDTVHRIKLLKDIRLVDYENSTEDQKKALILLGTYQMLGRANFNLTKIEDSLKKRLLNSADVLKENEILFSPFQTLEYDVVNKALGISFNLDNSQNNSPKDVKKINISTSTFDENKQKVSINKDVLIKKELVTKYVVAFEKRVRELYKKEKNIKKISSILVNEHINDKKDIFYPLIETLFRIIGVNCHKSRDGVNGERWDAMIRDPNKSIPIEIKSPTEEMHISIKAVRQALENKIILLSRKTYPTEPSCSTYAIGYLQPNNRAEVCDLIYSIKKTYGFSIAIFDLATLIEICTNIILLKKGIDIDKLYKLEGIINVDTFTN